MQGALDLAAVGGSPAATGRIVATAQLDDLAALRILDHLVARDVVGVLEPHLPARGQAEELLRRILLEIGALDVDLAGECDRT